jgi:hypothetical protein
MLCILFLISEGVFDNSELINLWMAEAYIEPIENKSTEAIGSKIF